MSQIGSTICTFVRGTVPPLKMEAEIWRVAGLHGYGLMLIGNGDSAARLTAVLLSNDLGVDTWAAAIHALQGSIVSIVNDSGDTYAGCFVVRVSPVVKSAAYIPGSSITKRGELQLEVLKVT